MVSQLAIVICKTSANRFSNPYQNSYCGTMFVTDIGYRFLPNFRFAVELGYATGGETRTAILATAGESNKDATYRGFISLQGLSRLIGQERLPA